jgi:hypothetical protein
MAMVLIVVIGMIMGLFVRLAIGKGGLQRCHIDKGGVLCVRLRNVYSDCL